MPTAASLDNTSFPIAGEAQLFDHPDDAEGAPAPGSDSLGAPTAAVASLNDPSSVNNSDGPDKNVEGWFYRHALPFSDGVKISLDDWGVYCVEQLKLLPSEVFLGMFEHEKLIVRETAKVALQKLKEEGPVDLSKCVVPPIESASAKFRNKKGTTGDGKPSPKKTQRNTKHVIEARQTEGEDPDPNINTIVRFWSTSGHQNNLLRVNVCNALRAGCTKAKIGRAIRVRVYGAWDGVGKSDMTYKKIKSTLLRIHNDMRQGKFDELINAQNHSEDYQKALSSKSVKPGARGRKEGMKMQARATKPDDEKLTTPELPELNAVDL